MSSCGKCAQCQFSLAVISTQTPSKTLHRDVPGGQAGDRASCTLNTHAPVTGSIFIRQVGEEIRCCEEVHGHVRMSVVKLAMNIYTQNSMHAWPRESPVTHADAPTDRLAAMCAVECPFSVSHGPPSSGVVSTPMMGRSSLAVVQPARRDTNARRAWMFVRAITDRMPLKHTPDLGCLSARSLNFTA